MAIIRRALLVTIATLCASVVYAHEIGTTRVEVVLDPAGSYRIIVVTDAAALLEKVEAVSRQPRSGVSDPGELQRRLTAALPLIVSRTEAAFDGVKSDTTALLQVDEPGSAGGVPAAALVLTGDRPAHAAAFTWAFGWTFASYALSVRSGEGPAATQWIDGRDASAPVPLEAVAAPISRIQLAGRYVALGFAHIVPKGLDHILFVLGIFLLTRRLRPMLTQISAFTIAHSLTLGLGMYGIVSAPSSVVEPLIAVSIAYIAVENLVVDDVRTSRVGLVFLFGLLHGLGFAGALSEVGLPRTDFVTALVGFNTGVELGQLAVVTAAFLAVGAWWRNRDWYRQRVVIPASACIGLLGVFWTIQRLHLV